MIKIVKFEEVTSTNDEIRRLARLGEPEGTVVVSERQTAGRGQYGRVWRSGEGGLFMSVLLRPNDGEIPAKCTITAALAAAGVLGADIKWVNDCVINGKKVCGILSEKFENCVAVGFGVNVNNADFPDEIRSSATSLFLETGERRDVTEPGRLIAEKFFELRRSDFSETLREYTKACITIGAEIAFKHTKNAIKRGLCVGIDGEGNLLVKTLDGGGEIVRVFSPSSVIKELK